MFVLFLYSRAARIAKEIGYKRIITYILESETGISLKASGWHLEATNCGGRSWNTPSRPRNLFNDENKKNIQQKKNKDGIKIYE